MRYNGKESKRGVFSRELVGSIVPVKKNEDARRVALYSYYAQRGLPVPFELANDEKALEEFAETVIEDTITDSDLELLEDCNADA